MAINYTNISVSELKRENGKHSKILSAQECRANYKLRMLQFFTPILNNSMKGSEFLSQTQIV